MTIAQIRHIRSIGRFRNYAAQGDVSFKKFTLLFGENGRGKTTLCAILRSLQSSTPAIITGRRTLGAAADPNVVIVLAGGQALFRDGAWNAPATQLRIFDAQYVAENIHSGDVIGPDQRRNLCRVIIGRDGVELALRYDQFDADINTKNAAIRDARSAITAHVPVQQVDQFVELAVDPEIDAKIEAKAREVDGLREIDRLRARDGLAVIDLPPLPTQLESILARTLEDVSRDAERLVKEHLAAHGMEGNQQWLSSGLMHLINETCPFCGQSTRGLDLIAAYRTFFNQSYTNFRDELTRYRANAARLFSDEKIEVARARLEGNVNGADLWSRYVTFARPELRAGTDIAAAITAFRSEVLALLENKLASPLDAMEVPASYTAAYGPFAAVTEAVTAYNTQVFAANAAIDAFKRAANPAHTQTTERDLAWLRLIKKRHEPAMAQACETFTRLNNEKTALEAGKRAAREQLDAHSVTVMTRYETAINANLKKFNAGFRIERVRLEYTGRVPNSTFCVVINDTLVEMGSADTSLDQPSFKNTLSAGDRSTLALAFFLAELAEDPDRAQCVVVFDDPFNSQDHFRRTCTMTEIRRCGDAVGQVVVMSHDRRFLKEIWDLPLPTADRKALWLIPSGGKDTVISEWPIETDTESEDAANRRVLLDYYHHNRGDVRDVIQKLRPVVETHMRRLAPNQLAGVNGLGNMIGKIRTDQTPPPLVGALDDLDDINTYTRRYMHGENPHASSATVSPSELHGFVQNVLETAGALTGA